VTAALRRAADAIVAGYRSSPAVATERGIALLALWAADAIAAGRLTPKDADATFVHLYVEIGNPAAGPELSEDANQLLLEAMELHDWGTPFSADFDEMRRLAFDVLGAHAAANESPSNAPVGQAVPPAPSS
jgi:hypothetical protein